jgi:hypothetical protein
MMQVLVLAVGGGRYFLAIVQERSLVWLLLTAYGLIDQLARPSMPRCTGGAPPRPAC